MTGTLYLCATPIGNLEDMTFRAIRTLREVNVIAAEDTRRTRKLLAHFDIHTPLIRFDEHCKTSVGEKILARLAAGESVAVVSDAGLPAISDPGSELVRSAIDAGLTVCPIPGANAALSALICSGLDTAQFMFVGFPPKSKKNRRELLQRLAAVDATLIFYEAPHRLKNFLSEAAEVFGTRQATLARELTKLHEEFLRGTLFELSEKISEPLGEFVIVVEGASSSEVVGNVTLHPMDALQSSTSQTLSPRSNSTEDIATAVRRLTASGLDKKSAMREVARQFNVSRREIYNALLKEEIQ